MEEGASSNGMDDRRSIISEVPIVVRGGCRHWPAFGKWSVEYFSEHFGESTVHVWRQQHAGELGKGPYPMKMKEFLKSIQQSSPEDEDVFCGNFSLSSIDSRLLADVVRPLSSQCGGDDGNMWIGRSGHVSHLHYDAHPGWLCCVAGKKRVRLWSPEAKIETRKKPINVAVWNGRGGPAEKWDDDSNNYISNDSSDISNYSSSSSSLCIPWNMDIILESGDCLMIPPYWWHLVLSSTMSVAVNYWYYPIEEVEMRRFTVGHAIEGMVRREMQHVMRATQQTWTLLSEQSIKWLYRKIQQGGATYANDDDNTHLHQYHHCREWIVNQVENYLKNNKTNHTK